MYIYELAKMKNNMKLKKYLFSTLSLLVISVTISECLYGQYQDSVLQNKKAIDSILLTEYLSRLPGNPQTFYSKGFDMRAKALQHLVLSCVRFYEMKFSGKKFKMSIYVLNESDWKKPPFGVPYGLPDYLPQNKLEIIGADKNALAHISGKPDDPVKSDSIVSGYDYVALHELGHYFFITLNNLRTEKWLDEFLASYFMICYVRENNIDFDLKNFFMPEGDQKHKTLQDFDKLYDGVGPANYDWYQKQFLQLGLQLYPLLRLGLISKIIENYSIHGKRLTPLALLKSIAPETTNNWLKQMQ